MSNKLNLPALIKYPFHYLALWVILLILSATVLLFPIHMSYQYHPVESPFVFGDMLPLFGVLFSAWFTIFILLLFFSSSSNKWHKLALISLFALVFGGFWIIHTPDGSHWDVLMQLGNIKYILDQGKLAFDIGNVGYLQFPIFHLINATLSLISGLGLFQTQTLYLLVSFTLLVALLFLLCTKWLGDSSLALLGMLLVVMGSIASRMLGFWPGNVAFLLLVMSLIWLFTRISVLSESSLISITIIMVFAISYVPTPVYFIFILAGIYALQRLARKETVSLLFVFLFIVIVISWEMLVAVVQSNNLGLWVRYFIEAIQSFQETYSIVSQPLGTSLSGTTPLWAIITRYFWIILVFGLGGIFGIWNLVKVRKLDSVELVVTGGLMGSGIFTVICAITFGYEAQWVRFQQIGPLFLVPILLVYISKFSAIQRFRKYFSLGLVVLVLAFSFPTFLLVGSHVPSQSVYSYYISGSEFLKSTYGNDEMDIYTTTTIKTMYFSFFPNVRFYASTAPDAAIDREKMWEEMNYLAASLENLPGGNRILVFSELFRLSPQNPKAIQPDDPQWVEFVNRINKNNRIFDNSYIQIFRALSGAGT